MSLKDKVVLRFNVEHLSGHVDDGKFIVPAPQLIHLEKCGDGYVCFMLGLEKISELSQKATLRLEYHSEVLKTDKFGIGTFDIRPAGADSKHDFDVWVIKSADGRVVLEKSIELTSDKRNLLVKDKRMDIHVLESNEVIPSSPGEEFYRKRAIFGRNNICRVYMIG